MKQGDKVHYTSHGSKENGIVKSIDENGHFAFVVFKCAGDWENYTDYTGQHILLKDLSSGWINESSNPQ